MYRRLSKMRNRSTKCGLLMAFILFFMEKQMVTFKNAAIACSVYLVSIVAFYGLRGTVSPSAQAHWGSGNVGGAIDLTGSMASLPGGHRRHHTYHAFQEKKEGGSARSGASAAGTEILAEGQG